MQYYLVLIFDESSGHIAFTLVASHINVNSGGKHSVMHLGRPRNGQEQQMVGWYHRSEVYQRLQQVLQVHGVGTRKTKKDVVEWLQQFDDAKYELNTLQHLGH